MIAVTGATGRVGTRLVPLLLEAGEQVRVMSRDVERACAMFGGDVETAHGDLDEPDSVAAALDGVDRVFLLVPAGPRQLTREGHVIRPAMRAGVRRVVKLSVLAAGERSPVQLARWHRQAETELASSGLGYTILRPPFFMQNFFAMVSNGAIHTAAEDGKIAMIDVRDVAAVAAAALTEDGHEGKTYTITGPQAVTFDEAARELTAAAGRPIRHVRIAPEAVTPAMTKAGAPDWYASDMAVLHRLFAAGLEAVTTDDVKTVTGREARRLAEFVREEFAALTPSTSPGAHECTLP
jgi:uncharacterized protein YbjT (DUF2867 family)